MLSRYQGVTIPRPAATELIARVVSERDEPIHTVSVIAHLALGQCLVVRARQCAYSRAGFGMPIGSNR